MFYADDGLIVGIKPICVQGTLMLLIRMFERIRLYTNLANTK